jgi:hypothetical protein
MVVRLYTSSQAPLIPYGIVILSMQNVNSLQIRAQSNCSLRKGRVLVLVPPDVQSNDPASRCLICTEHLTCICSGNLRLTRCICVAIINITYTWGACSAAVISCNQVPSRSYEGRASPPLLAATQSSDEPRRVECSITTRKHSCSLACTLESGAPTRFGVQPRKRPNERYRMLHVPLQSLD